MIKIGIEKQADSVWLSLDNSEWEMSRGAFSQLCLGLEKFDSSSDTVKEIRLDVSDDDYEAFEE